MRSTVLAETKKYSLWLSLQNKVHSTDLDQRKPNLTVKRGTDSKTFFKMCYLSIEHVMCC